MKDQERKDQKRSEQHLNSFRAEENYMPADSRARCREGFDMTIADLVSIGKGEIDNATAAGRIRAIEALAKYGYGKATVFVQNEQLIHVIGRITCKYLDDRETFIKWVAEVKHALEKE